MTTATQPLTPDDILPDFEVMSFGFERFFLRHWFPVGIGLPFGLLVALASAYALLDGTFPALAFPWTDSILTGWFVWSLLIPLILCAALYAAWTGRIAPLFRRLVAGKRLISPTPGSDLLAEYDQFTREYQRLLHSGWRWLPVAVSVGLGVVFQFLSNPYADLYRPTGRPLMDGLALAHLTLLYVIMPLIWDYFVGIAVWSWIATSITIRKLTPAFILNIQPSHPDHSGGLKFVAEFCQFMALPLFIAVILASIYGIGGVLTGWINVSRDVRAIVLVSNASLLIGVVLTFIVFLWPLWDIHLAMLDKRRAYENEFADRAAAAESRLRAYLDESKLAEAKTARDELDTLQAVHPDKTGYPVWPFDQKVLLRFLTPQILPILSLVIGGLNDTMRDALGSVLVLLFGGQ